MLRIHARALAVLWSLTGLDGLSHGAIISFSASLSPANENPPTASTATGFTTVSFDTVTQLLNISVTFSGLTTPTTAAHIHCCIASPGNTGVATTVPAFPGFPLGVTSGSYNMPLDLTQAASYNPAFITANGGTVASAEAVFVTGFQNGLTYLNIHTQQFGGGEIRAFLATPEPASAALAGLALAGLLAIRRKTA
jgi:MYXO-CTERM domain-containing protein